MELNKGSRLIMNVGISSICNNLGYTVDGVYIPSDECEENLNELLDNLQKENNIQRIYRHQLCFFKVVELDIVPLIKCIKDQPEIFSAAIRFLATLIQPVECLVMGMPDGVSLPWVPDVKRMLINTKKLCTDKDLIGAITSEITVVIEDHNGQAMSDEDCDFINKCLLLFRNLLYIQDIESHRNQETIVLYMLECRIGELINKLIAIPQREYWSASIIQLVSLMYTGHTLDILIPCLNTDDMSDITSSCDSDDNDYEFLRHNNDCDSHRSSQFSLPSLFGKTLHVKEDSSMMSASSQSSLQYSGQSGDEEMLVNDECEERRLEKFRNMLLQFTQAFINEGFGHLVHDLKNVLISDMKDSLDDTYFLWAIAFFLKIARQENAPFRVIRMVLTSDLFGFLAYEGVILTEQLMIAKKKNNDSTFNTRRLHLTICALNELLKTLSKYCTSTGLDNCDREYLTGLQKDLANLTDLRMVFVLLIRHYQSEGSSACFLEELITTNHTFLELLDKWNQHGWMINHFDMVEHVKLFGTRNIMQFYGILLSNFNHNSNHVNRCIFTMMHHVAGDCGKVEVLLQLPIIQSLMEVDSSKNHLTKEMVDLTEYVLNTFLNIAKNDPLTAATHLYGQPREETAQSGQSSPGGSSNSEVDDMLFSLYTELQKEQCLVDLMVERFADIGIIVTAEEVWSRLHLNGLITDSEYLSSQETKSEHLMNNENGDIIQRCIEALKEKNQEENIKWIQTLLCETAYVKLGKHCEKTMIEEPVTMYHVGRGSSVPLVLYKEDQDALLKDPHFKSLLHYMGFHTPQDVDMIFPRIPSFWTSEQLIKQAQKLGPLDNEILKFDPENVKFENEEMDLPGLTDDKKYQDYKDKSVELSRSRTIENKIFWLEQIQQYNIAHSN